MRNRTWIAALALTGCALVAGGCKANDTATPAAAQSGGASATTKATGAADEVVAAAEKLLTTSYKFSTGVAGPVGLTGEGAVDPATKTVTMRSATGPAKFELLSVGGDVYLKYPKDMPGAVSLGNGKWLHIDVTKVPSMRSLGIQDSGDPMGVGVYAKALTSVEKTGPGRYRGVLDLTKSPMAAQRPLPDGSDVLKAVPFEATVDDKGRLSSMDTTTKVNGSELTTRTSFSDFGTKVTATKPAPTEVTEAPQSFYGILGA